MPESNPTTAGLLRVAQELEKRQDVIAVYKRMTQNEYLQEFACIFFDNMSYVMEIYRLTQTEMRVLFALGKYLQFGNRIKIKQRYLANELKISPTNISTAIKRLKTTDIILEKEGELYFNPYLFAKGKIDTYLLEMSSNTQIEPSIQKKEK